MKTNIKLLFLVSILTISILFAAAPAGYYSSADGLSGETLKTALHHIIDGHRTYSYDNLWTTLVETDEDPNNSSNFILIYTGRSLPKTASYPQWNREHSWPKSHGGFGDSAPAGTDMHHLRPCDVSVNSARGNKDYDNGGSLVSGTTDCYTDADSFEPRDEVKGDVARMMFYMVTRYKGDGEPDLELVDYTGTSGSILGKLSTLLEWHNADPVDDFERRRNDVVYGYQENRNPFIDHPEYVSYIWGGVEPGGISAPIAQAATNIALTSFTANWSSQTTATGYYLYVATDENFISTLAGYNPKDLNALSENISGLTSETHYYYKLKAYNSEYESDFSNTITLKTSTTPPAGNGEGTFTKITSIHDLLDGYYIIANSGDAVAMVNQNTGSTFPYTAISPLDYTITHPDVSIVWKITDDGNGNKIIYHEQSKEYVSLDSDKNAVHAANAVTGDHQRWTIRYENNEFISKNNQFPARNLRYNPGYGFRCYTSHGEALSLYKLQNDTPLPITLAAFRATAKAGLVELAWETASETNNAAFLVYRNNKLLARIDAAGTSSETQFYSYQDATIIPGIEYTYFLADVDFANKETRYNDNAITVELSSNLSDADFVIGAAYPNPFNPTALVPLKLSRDAFVEAKVYSITGREITTLIKETMTAGSHNLQINAKDMTTGLYLLKVVVENTVDVQKIAYIK